MSAALSLDAADGVIDGRHFGRPIVQAGGPQFGGFAQPAFGGAQTFGQPVQTFGAPVQFGGVQSFSAPTFGAPVFGGQTIGAFGGASSTAAALDAADGVIDGRHFGRPIVQAGPQFGATSFGVPAFGGQTFGAQFVQAPQVIQGAPSFVQRPAIIGAPVQGFGGIQSFGAPAFGTTFGGASSTAAALDAADGVIDGRHFGRPIVQAGAPSFVGAPQFAGGFPGTTFGQSFVQPTQFGGFAGGFPQAAFGAQSRAAQLDAADGVIDGKFFGRQIVQAGRF